MEPCRIFRVLLRDESGVTSIEYALLGSLIAMVIVTTVATLGVNLQGLYEMVAGKVQEATKGI